MPTYKVIEPGFRGGTLHKPNHPRHGVVTTDKPLDPIPSWLELTKNETPAKKNKSTAAAKTAAKKVADDKAAVEGASFLMAPGGSAVETL
jgi:hypothetical protein